MKTTNEKLGRTLSGNTQRAQRLAALQIRRQEQNWRRFLESLNGGLEFSQRASYPAA